MKEIKKKKTFVTIECNCNEELSKIMKRYDARIDIIHKLKNEFRLEKDAIHILINELNNKIDQLRQQTYDTIGGQIYGWMEKRGWIKKREDR